MLLTYIIIFRTLKGYVLRIFITGSTVPRHRLKDIHVWGCPIYILDPQLQGGQKLPRWEPRSRRGVFMGFSHQHSSEVPLVLNLATGSITPQYHVVFDDLFSTVSSVERENEPPDNWDDLCLENTTLIPTDTLENVSDAPIGTFDFDWTNSTERDLHERATTRQDAIRSTIQPPVSSTIAAPVSSSVMDASSSVPPTTTTVSSALPLGTFDASAFPLLPSSVAPAVSLPVSAPAPPPSIVAPVVIRRSNRSTKGTFSKPRYIGEAFLSMTGFSLAIDGHEAALAYMAELHTCSDTGLMDVIDPRVYALKTPKLRVRNEDNFSIRLW